MLIFGMVNFQFFVYDSSIAAPLSRVPVWPYSLTYQMPHKCHGNAQNCPSRYCLPTCTVQCTDIPTLSPTRCRTSVTAMHRNAPAGTAYLPLQCTGIPAPSPTRCRKQCHRNAQYCPKYCLPILVQCTDIPAPSTTRYRKRA